MAISNADGSIVLTTKVDQSGLKKGMTTMKSGVSSLVGSLRKLAMAVGVAFGVREIVKFSKEVSNLATTTEASVQSLIDIYGSASKAVGDFIDANAQALGMSRAAAASYASIYGNLFSVWADQATNAELTNTYLNMTAVVASKTGRTVEDVQERIRSGLLGNTEAIEDLGVFVNVKTIEMTDAFKRMANGKSWEQLDAYTQQQIRSMAILEQATSKYGNEVAQTTALTKAQFQAAWQDFQATWGQVVNRVLIPVLEVLTDILVKATAVMQSLFGISSLTISQSDTISNATQNQENLTDAVKETEKAVKKILAPFDDLQIITSNIVENSEQVTGGLNKIDSNIAINNSQKQESVKEFSFITRIKEMIGELTNAFSGFKKIDFTNFTESLKKFLEPLERLGSFVWDTILWAIENPLTLLSEMVIEDALPRFFETFGGVLSIFTTILENLSPIWQSFYDKLLKPIIDYAWEAILPLWDQLNGYLEEFDKMMSESTIWKDLQTILEKIYPIIEPIAKGFIDIVTWVGKLALAEAWTALEYIVDQLESGLGAIVDIINGDFEDAWEKFKDFLLDNTINFYKESVDNLKNSFEDLKEWFNNIDWNEVAYNVGEGLANIVLKFDEFVKTWWQKTKDWWNNDVKPLFSLETWKELGNNIIEGLKWAFTIGLQNLINGAIGLINSVLEGWNSVANKTDLLPSFELLKEVEWFKETSGSEKAFRFGQSNIVFPNINNLLPTNPNFIQSIHGGIGGKFGDPNESFENVSFLPQANGSGSKEIILEIDGREFGRAVLEYGGVEGYRVGTKLVRD